MIDNISTYDGAQTEVIQAGKFVRDYYSHAPSFCSRQNKASLCCLSLRQRSASLVCRLRGNTKEINAQVFFGGKLTSEGWG